MARGLDPSEYLLVAFGGAGPLHAAALARELGMRVLIPEAPHAFWNYKKWFKGTMDRSAAFFLQQLGKAK